MQIKHTNEFFELKKVFQIRPFPKPRMTKSDRWRTDPNHPDPKRRQRKVVRDYWQWKQAVVLMAGSFVMPRMNVWIVFHIAMPTGWSEKKMVAMNGEIHQKRPDKDNLEKGLTDALHVEDSHLADSRVTKLWCRRGRERIEIYF